VCALEVPSSAASLQVGLQGTSVQILLHVNLIPPLPPATRALQVVLPVNGDPFIGMLETPVTSSPAVANFLSNLPAYRTGVSPLLRGVEVGLAHGFLLVGPFVKLGPLRATEFADKAGCLAGAGLVLILTLALAAYGAVTFQQDKSQVGVKTLSGPSPASFVYVGGDGGTCTSEKRGPITGCQIGLQ
jgi:Photosystem I reaction centre subunit XI